MKRNLNLYYDEEGDFLEIGMGNPQKGSFKNLGKGVFKRVDDKTGKVTGIAVFGFKKRTAGLKEVNVSLPIKIELAS